MNRLLRVISVCFAFLFLSTTYGWAADWVMARVTGVVWVVTPGAPAQNATAGQVVANGSTISTGPDARALLMRGDESMSLGPNTTVAVQARGTSTTIIELEGTVTFDVEHRILRNFAVQTPLLTSVVKGTQFIVTVTPDASEVRVTEGTVAVTALASGRRAMLEAGQMAIVTASQPADLQLTNMAALASPVGAGGHIPGVSTDTVGAVTQTAAVAPSDPLSVLSEGSGGIVTAALGDVGDTVGVATDTVGEVVGAAVETVGEVVGDTVETVGEVVDDVGDTVGEVVDDVGDTAGEVVSDVGDAAGDVVDDVGDTAGDVVDGAGSLLGSLL